MAKITPVTQILKSQYGDVSDLKAYGMCAGCGGGYSGAGVGQSPR